MTVEGQTVDLINDMQAEWNRRGWVEAGDGMAAVLELVRVQRMLVERIERTLKPFELTFARYEALMLLSLASPRVLSISSLGDLLQVHSTSATNAVDRLEEQGLATRGRSRMDRRVVLVQITPTGRRIAATATRDLNKEVFTDLGLSASHERLLWSLLRRFRANAGDFEFVPSKARPTE